MNEVVTVKIEKVNDVLVTTSNRVAEELGVEHKNLLAKIDDYSKRFSSAETLAQFYIPSNYVTKDGRTVRNYLITEKGVAQLVGGYSAAVPRAFDLNVAYINEFERMKEMLRSGAPKSLKEALILALEQQERLEALELENKEKDERIESMQPKALFADAVSASHTSILVGDLAKLLKQNGVDIGQRRLFEKLRKDGFLMKSGSSKNMPTQRAMEQGLFEIKESSYIDSQGNNVITKTSKVTGKGQVFFVNRYMAV